jgi:hypothetical protein
MTGIQAWVLEYLHKHPGEEVWLNDLVREYPTEVEPRIVQSAVARAIRVDPHSGIQIVARGNSWRYNPTNGSPKQGVSDLFQTVAVLKDGRVLVEDEHGTAYWLTEA